ncbi:RICIN domain-containing protein [Actinomycetes bacterium KLBMP 9797]
MATTATTMAASALVALSGPTAARADFGDGWRSLVNIRSGLVLGIERSSNANAAKVIQWTPIYQPDGQAVPDQDWRQEWVDNRWFYLRNAGTPDWKALAIGSSSTANNAPAIQYTHQPQNWDQQWEMIDSRPEVVTIPTFYFLRNRNSMKCLAIPSGSQSPGTVAVQYTCLWNNDDQMWEFKDN